MITDIVTVSILSGTDRPDNESGLVSIHVRVEPGISTVIGGIATNTTCGSVVVGALACVPQPQNSISSNRTIPSLLIKCPYCIRGCP